MLERLTTAIEDLPERERLIITLYYYEEMTMKEIGLILGVDQSRVSQINASAVLHLRAGLCAPAIVKEPQNNPEGEQPKRARGEAAGHRIVSHSS
jgi:RNA polymerase sigma factor FliA